MIWKKIVEEQLAEFSLNYFSKWMKNSVKWLLKCMADNIASKPCKSKFSTLLSQWFWRKEKKKTLFSISKKEVSLVHPVLGCLRTYLPRYVRLYKICRYLAFKMFVCRCAARITVSRNRHRGSKYTHVLSHKKNIVFP